MSFNIKFSKKITVSGVLKNGFFVRLAERENLARKHTIEFTGLYSGMVFTLDLIAEDRYSQTINEWWFVSTKSMGGYTTLDAQVKWDHFEVEIDTQLVIHPQIYLGYELQPYGQEEIILS